MDRCPICATDMCQGDLPYVICARCGEFEIAEKRVNDALDRIQFELGPPEQASGFHKRSHLSHVLRLRQLEGKPVELRLRDVKAWKLSDPLPSPAEQFDRLILWMGEHQVDPTEWMSFFTAEVEAWIGARISKTRGAAVVWLIEQKKADEFVERSHLKLRLTMAGWKCYEELKRGRIDSHKAFMAMKFNEFHRGDRLQQLLQARGASCGFQFV